MPSTTRPPTGRPSVSRLGFVLLAIAAAAGLLISATVVFAATDDTRRTGEGSQWYDLLVEPVMDDADPATMEVPKLDSTFGQEGGSHALVLYDTQGERPESYEMDGLAAANLATHFGLVTMEPVADYQGGTMEDYDAVIYLGSSWAEELPQDFIDDVLDGQTEVLWAGANADELTGGYSGEHAEEFIDSYHWDPSETTANARDDVTKVLYKETELDRDESIDGHYLHVPAIVEESEVEVLAWALCGTLDQSRDCEGAEGDRFPWAIRSGNLTYVSEVPFDFMEESSRYLVWADLYYDLLDPEAESEAKAAVRLEDVGPESDPEDLKRIADLLYERGIPFQVALFPVHVAKVPDSDPTRWYAVSLHETPRVVEALQYMEERGGTMIHHGTTHQYGAWDNPYSSQSGADYEFFRAHCSATKDPPYEFQDCEQDSWVRLTGAVSKDAPQDHAERMRIGRQIIDDVGLQAPDIFEVPHYAASPNAYLAMAEDYDYRYERVQYFAGLISGKTYDSQTAFTQFFPYRVHDVYGQTILPENLGNIAVEWQNNHAPRDPQFLIDNAERNLVVRESTASFFFHPFLDPQYLADVVDGVEDLGYTFVPADELP